jgi:small subunit ribosomal protein S6
MTAPALTYDLVLVLDPQGDEGARAKIVADTRSAIEGQGELLRHDEWGERPLAYPIERRSSGIYHLMQFHPAGAELLSALDRTLRIADGVLRFRIIKLKPGVPDAPDMRASAPRRAEADAPQPAPAPAEGEGAEAAVGEPA